MDISRIRGIRNCNPCNIRLTSTKWRGKVTPNTDGSFEQFESMAFGIRAALITMRTYITRHHCNTIEKAVARWAPSTENNTAAYIADVCQRTGMYPYTHLAADNHVRISILVWAMAIHECGVQLAVEPFHQAWDLV